MFDPSKQQLDLPAFAVERGNLPGRALHIVGQDGQPAAVLAAQDDAAQWDRQTSALLRGELHHGIAFDTGRLLVVPADRPFDAPIERHIAFGPGDKAAARVVQAAPPGVVSIALSKT